MNIYQRYSSSKTATKPHIYLLLSLLDTTSISTITCHTQHAHLTHLHLVLPPVLINSFLQKQNKVHQLTEELVFPTMNICYKTLITGTNRFPLMTETHDPYMYHLSWHLNLKVRIVILERFTKKMALVTRRN